MWETWVQSPGLGRSPREGKGYPCQYSSLENSLDYIVHGAAKSLTRLNDECYTYPEDPTAGHGHVGRAKALGAVAVIVDDESVQRLRRESSAWKQCLKSCCPGAPCALPPAHRGCLEVGRWHLGHRWILPCAAWPICASVLLSCILCSQAL